MSESFLAEQYGPEWRAIQFVRDEQVPLLTPQRVARMYSIRPSPTQAMRARQRAFTIAGSSIRQRNMVAASEALRQSVWDVVWDSRWADAWFTSWMIADAGLGLAVADLVGTGGFGVDDYYDLVGAWVTGFPDLPIPRGVTA